MIYNTRPLPCCVNIVPVQDPAKTNATLEEQEADCECIKTNAPTLCSKSRMSSLYTNPLVLRRYAAKIKEETAHPVLMARRVSASLLFLAPPALEETALARRTTSLARWVTVRLVVSPPPVALSARSATSSADTALDRARSRSDSRTVVVGVRICGAGARSEERVRWRTGVAPWPRTRVVLVRARISWSTGASGVIADAVVHGGGARGPGVEEVGRAAG